MELAVAYLQQRKLENLDDFLSSANTYIANLEIKYKIVHVIFDKYNDRYHLDNFISSAHAKFDTLIIDHVIVEDFDKVLIKELSKINKYRVEYLIREP